MRKREFEAFLGKQVGVVYLDSNRECYVKGIIKSLDENNLILQTRNDTPLFLALKAVRKIKVVSGDSVG